jgi:hypothetical protein
MKREIGGNILRFLFYFVCGYAIVRISIWSYYQTQAFFSPYDTDGTTVISNALSLFVTYGQNVVLFLAAIEAGRRLAYQNKIKNISNQVHISILKEEIEKSQKESYIYYFLFGACACIDAGTNLGQFYVTTMFDASLKFTGITLTIFGVVGTILSILVVFVEELFMSTVNAILHAFNDIRESMGRKRIDALDLFIDPDKILATRLGERNGGGNNSGSGNSGGGNNRQEQGRREGVNTQSNTQTRQDLTSRLPRQKTPSERGENNKNSVMMNEPTYHQISNKLYTDLNKAEEEGNKYNV